MKINFRYTTDYDNKNLLGDVDMEVNIDDASYEDVERMFHRFMAAIGWTQSSPFLAALEETDKKWDELFLEDNPPQERDLFDD